MSTDGPADFGSRVTNLYCQTTQHGQADGRRHRKNAWGISRIIPNLRVETLGQLDLISSTVGEGWSGVTWSFIRLTHKLEKYIICLFFLFFLIDAKFFCTKKH